MASQRNHSASAKRAVRILGLDPGSRFTGFGLVERQGSHIRALEAGRIRLEADSELATRLASLCAQLDDLLVRMRPDAVALESLFHGINSRSLIVLAQTRGALLAQLAGRRLPIVEYSPAEIKQAITGNGRADKQQVARMVSLLLALGEHNLAEDATDALAAAICCSQRLRTDRLTVHIESP